MTYEIGTKVKMSYGPEYTVVGFHWSDTVFAPNDKNDKQVLIYTDNEIAELIEKKRIKTIQ